jgi:dUTP pyrophosphatase
MKRLSVPIKFKRLHEKAVLPKYGTPGAACVDLVATEIRWIDEDKVEVRYGFAYEVDPHYKLTVQPRSSFGHKGWFMANSPAQLDSDYRGEAMSKFQAIPVGIRQDPHTGKVLGFLYEDFPFKVGDRVTQCGLEVAIHGNWQETKEELSTTLRGEGGFGSTGK